MRKERQSRNRERKLYKNEHNTRQKAGEIKGVNIIHLEN